MITVAILEDQRVFRDALVAYLSANSFLVTCATERPAEFLAHVRTRPPALAIVDLLLDGDLSEPRGIAAIEELCRSVPGTRVVALSGAYSADFVEACAAAGATAYLDKNELAMAAVPATLREIAAGARVFPVPASAAPRATPPTTALSTLTPREYEVLRYVSTGADNLKISSFLGISERTVRAHISALYRKLEADNRTGLALLARSLGVRAPLET